MVVRWSQSAADDLKNISEYTKETFGPAQANRIARSIYETARSLRNHPRRGRAGRQPNTREILIMRTPFYIVYTVGDSRIEIVRIFHSAQLWP
jgi:toxin ParE1/3/4